MTTTRPPSDTSLFLTKEEALLCPSIGSNLDNQYCNKIGPKGFRCTRKAGHAFTCVARMEEKLPDNEVYIEAWGAEPPPAFEYEEWPPDQCQANRPSGGTGPDWECTRHIGHEGKHAAHWGNGRLCVHPDGRPVVWGEAPKPEPKGRRATPEELLLIAKHQAEHGHWAPSSTIDTQCGQQHHTGDDAFACNRPKTHTGAHVAFKLRKVEEPIYAWEDS